MFATIPADKLKQFLSSPPQDNKIYFVQNEKHNYCVLNGMSFDGKMKYINNNLKKPQKNSEAFLFSQSSSLGSTSLVVITR
jgi:hypothetical protein